MATVTSISFEEQVGRLQYTAPLPPLYRVRQHFHAPVLEDLDAAVAEQCRALDGRIRPGMRIGLTAGSRGIANIARILRAVGREVRARGGEPFIIPAMGSHGGATAGGQTAMLADLGITEASVEMPVVSSMEVREVDRLEGGPRVFVSVTALEADGVIVIGRVKPHTDFRSSIESGLSKMCAIGLGKHRGAQEIHSYGTQGLAYWLPRAARAIVRHARVLLGLAILENACDQIARIVAVAPEDIGGPAEEALLQEARGLMASLPFDQFDVLVVDEMGKNISGTGMDTNIIGRMMIQGVPEFERPRIKTIAVLDLTDAAHGNAAGVGLADVTTMRLYRKIDFRATYINGLTSGIGGVQRVKLPIVAPTDRDAIAAAILTCGRADATQVQLVRIKNTLELHEILISEALLPQARQIPHLEILGGPEPFEFDAEGRIRPFSLQPVAHS